MNKPREFWITINACSLRDRVFKTEDDVYAKLYANDSIFHVREVLADSTQLPPNYIPSIDWQKVWRQHDKITKNLVSAIEQVEIQELVEKQFRGEE